MYFHITLHRAVAAAVERPVLIIRQCGLILAGERCYMRNVAHVASERTDCQKQIEHKTGSAAKKVPLRSRAERSPQHREILTVPRRIFKASKYLCAIFPDSFVVVNKRGRRWQLLKPLVEICCQKYGDNCPSNRCLSF